MTEVIFESSHRNGGEYYVRASVCLLGHWILELKLLGIRICNIFLHIVWVLRGSTHFCNLSNHKK